MTIQIFGVVWFGGNTETRIEEYYNDEKEAQAAWDRLWNKYENAKCKTNIYATKNEGDNVRPETGYGKSPYINGATLGRMVTGKYANY